MKDYNLVTEYHREMESDKWRLGIPFLKFPENYEIKVIPPFAGAVVRFKVRFNDREISVYLDCYDMLGFVNEPYWEIYPSTNGDVARFVMNDVKGLIDEIKNTLEPK